MKRKDGNEIEENKDKDTRHYLVEDNEGHVKGSKQAEFNEQITREADDDDKSELNKLDDR
jgi:hypothetical protein